MVKVAIELFDFSGCSEVRETRRRLLMDVLAKVGWSHFDVSPYNRENCCSFLAYGKLELEKWEKLERNQKMTFWSTDEPELLIGCLMLSALHGERDTTSLMHAPFDLVWKVAKMALVLDREFEILFSFMMDLSREELLDLATMKTEDPVLLSDLPSFWELFFHLDKGLVKVKRQKALTMLNEDNVLEIIVKGLLKSSDDDSRFPEVELRRVFLRERGLVPKERVKKAMSNSRVLPIIARRASDSWLKDVNEGKTYMIGVVQLHQEIFQDELDDCVDKLAERVPVQLLVVAEEKVRSGGGQQWANLLKRVKVFMRGHFQSKLALNDMRSYKCKYLKYNRECDWYAFLVVVLNKSPEIYKKIPADYVTRTKLYPTWSCSLLRVWIQLFGEEETRRQADQIPENELSFWDWASRDMKDGELLHIAVELGSLIGVRWTAWPTMVNWRDGNNNRTAVELAHKKLGNGHEVTEHLGRVGDNLTESGFIVS